MVKTAHRPSITRRRLQLFVKFLPVLRGRALSAKPKSPLEKVFTVFLLLNAYMIIHFLEIVNPNSARGICAKCTIGLPERRKLLI